MRLSRFQSVVKKRKDQKLRNKFKGKKKHKRLDAICEKAYNSSLRGVEKVESSQIDDGGNELEVRRSSRARRAPILLDSSPPPRKKRKVDRSGVSRVEKLWREDGVKCEMECSSSKDLDGQSGGWGSRLRSREKIVGFSRRKKGQSSLRGKRKLFEDSDEIRDDMETHCDNMKDGMGGEKLTVVKSKRPGRIKASNVLANVSQDIDIEGGLEDNTEKNSDDVIEVLDEGEGLCLEIKLECSSNLGVQDGCMASKLGEREETAVQRESQLEECHTSGNVETREENMRLEEIAGDLVLDQRNDIEVDYASDQEKDVGQPDIPLEYETYKKSDKNYNALDVADHKPRIKLGRRCGLCGGGTEGKPPKLLVRDGASSDNEAYSGSSASEETNYDVWDGFGDNSGWLGRLLGPINDRFGIAGIWVHQQCAVWSPEIYFAGLGCLKNVRAALYRGRLLKCSRCRRTGATIGCRVDRCPKTYHLPCARAKGCIFDHRKFLIACTDHRHLFQPHGIQNTLRLKKLKSKKMKLELRKIFNDAYRKDIEAEEKWLENCGEDEEFLKRESKRLHRDLLRIAPVYIGGANSESGTQFQGWESVAGLQDVIQCMKEVVILPLLYPNFFNNLGLTPPRGVLLHGYPGTGKTLVVRALVGSCARGDKKIAYFARKGADCLGKYVGDSERQLRLLFDVAEKSQPSIIFFDEIDGLAPCRTNQQDQTHSSVVSTLLALMDGLKSRGSVVVIGATNRPDAVDPALRRPGRFDREIYFPLPSVKDREAILLLHTQKWPKPISGSLLKWVAKRTIGFAGADLQALCTQAAIIALRKSFPLQEVLSAAEAKASRSNCPSIPFFSVEERDWLQALSCAPPPCSRRECGVAVYNVVSSPLNTFVASSLLHQLTKLLVRMYLDECVWLPPPLNKASILVKNVIVSALNSRGMQSENWWSHVDEMLQEVNVTNEIEKNLLLANVLVGQTNLCSSDVIEEKNDEDYPKNLPSNPQSIGGRAGLLKNMSYAACNKSGFQMLISGNPRFGQRHLASCLLHCFVGHVDVWKVDLASISHEGHGDMILGLTQILMRCAGAKLCMIYMPRIDLWAIETYNETSDGHRESSSVEFQPSEKISCDGKCEIDREHNHSSSPEEEVTALKKASYLWTSFIGQVESMRVNTSLIILATSELPISVFPHIVRQFFGSEVVNCSSSSPVGQKLSRFSVQLDGKFNHNKVINSFAVKLSKDLAQNFVQSFHSINHILEKSLEKKACDKVDDDVDRVHHGKSCPVSPLNQVTNKMAKGKSNLLLAISTVGYQILCYPHFAELCWVTSKLKAGPCANVGGPWKGWPFNSCIVRPVNSTEKVDAASSSSIIKSRESGVVRGLVAVGLSAYRGEFTSLREVCSEVRKVLETLVARIDDKIEAGKDRTRYIRLLSQVAYLEDMVISWAHSLQSLEVDTPVSKPSTNDAISEGVGHKLDVSDLTEEKSEVPEETLKEINARDAGHSDPTDGEEVAVTIIEEPPQLVVLDHSSPIKHSSLPDKVNVDTSKEEAARDSVESAKLSNGFMGSYSEFQANGDKHGSLTDNNILFKDSIEGKSNGSGLNVDNALKPKNLGGSSSDTCFYQCCSECFTHLHYLVLGIINDEWGHRGSDSTVEDVHDFLASLSANLHSAVCKLSQTGSLMTDKLRDGNSKYRNYFDCKKNCRECRSSEKLIVECDCHTTSKNTTRKEKDSQVSLGLDESRFIFRDGVLADLDTGIDVSYHCRFEKLCLCSLMEWLVNSKEPFD
ncbi:hypothetical protein ACJIZ3_011096 [Penstemon smallii]|uniref:PHD-type domain-containing protein n=1 Tax=Penstemon smallii TaxID=265156 RepID=A0ABD3UI61_9LAMI